jgi:alkylation response protein AidB-like acyl-CoA dehydrogenase
MTGEFKMARAHVPAIDFASITLQLKSMEGLDRLRALEPSFADASEEMIEAILDQAARFAADRLEMLNASGEITPPTIVDGRVDMGENYRAVWREFASGGWMTLDLPAEFGGQALPLAVALAVQEIFDRHCCAFGMLPVPIRSAVRLIDTYASPEIREEWLPKLLFGEWGATICISETGAGSDVSRMTTTAQQNGDGTWSITGEKQWISFGSHDLTNQIGHCLLARTQGAKGLSLFLVPDRIDGLSNGVFVRSLERKLGLHLSPTCAMGFEGAQGHLLGEEGRGLAQMFVMIANMRMSVGAMGLGMASGAADVALAYARERVQGGKAIIAHADVERQLLDQQASVELLRGLVYMAAIQSDLGRTETEAEARSEAAVLAQWLLPIVKTLGGETAFNVASGAIQVLGGAGYTQDWPVEQVLRDARVLTIFEGTTGMQAIDLLHRRLWKDEGRGLQAFLRAARQATAGLALGGDLASVDAAHEVFDSLEQAARALDGMKDDPRKAEAGACAFLALAGHAGLTWIAVRLATLEGSTGAERLRDLARYHLAKAGAKATGLGRQIKQAGAALELAKSALQ